MEMYSSTLSLEMERVIHQWNDFFPKPVPFCSLVGCHEKEGFSIASVTGEMSVCKHSVCEEGMCSLLRSHIIMMPPRKKEE